MENTYLVLFIVFLVLLLIYLLTGAAFVESTRGKAKEMEEELSGCASAFIFLFWLPMVIHHLRKDREE